MPNPFAVEGTGDEYDGPLCPWQVPAHEAYYVDVDSTGTAYHKFRERLAPYEVLTTRGRLVVVAGESGCGKSSLIHRCAREVDAALNRADRRGVFVVDLLGYTYDEAGARSQAVRVVDVCRRVLWRLRDQTQIPVVDLLALLPAMAGGPHGTEVVEDVYHRLAKLARHHKFVLIILLPKVIDTWADLEKYSWIAADRERLLFFAESSDVAMVDDFLRRQSGRGTGTFGLTVGLLEVGDGSAFTENRFSMHRPGSVATISPKEMDKVMRHLAGWDKVSVRTMQSVLYKAWQEYEGVSPPPKVDAMGILNDMLKRVIFERRESR